MSVFPGAVHSKGETLGGGWGGAPTPTPQRITNKRANSPQGYEASGKGALQEYRTGPSPAAAKPGQGRKPLSGSKGETLGGGWGGAPSPTPQRITNQRANSPQGYEASGNSALQKYRTGPSLAAAKPGQGRKPLSGSKGETLGGGWGGAPSPTPQRITNKRAKSPQGYEASDKSALLGPFGKLFPTAVFVYQTTDPVLVTKHGVSDCQRTCSVQLQCSSPPAAASLRCLRLRRL